MSTSPLSLPMIDLDPYLNPTCPEDKQRTIDAVREACAEFGFFQLKGHGVPIEMQKELFRGIGNVFNQPKEAKMELSFLKNPCRRGYEGSGDSLREGDALPDSKEAFYIGREDPKVDHYGFYGPNLWPNIAVNDFKEPVSNYYEATSNLGRIVWEILLQGLGHSPDLMETFARRPMVVMKMIRYPPSADTRPGQFGVGAHNDFGGVTVLLQQPERAGLEVWHQESGKWVAVTAKEDVFVINCGDMIHGWSGGQYRSVKHRVVNKANKERLSCATFWHGDFDASNPLNPEDPDRRSVGQLLLKRFSKQFSLPEKVPSAPMAGGVVPVSA